MIHIEAHTFGKLESQLTLPSLAAMSTCWFCVSLLAIVCLAPKLSNCDDFVSSNEDGLTKVSEIKGLWSPLLDWVLLTREKKVMKVRDPTRVSTNVHKITRPQASASAAASPGQGVTETDLYLLGAIEKLVYRVDFMEKRLRKTEELLFVVMAGTNDKIDHEPCPTNFTRVGRNCYHFSQRQFNWKSAASMCKSLGSTLAEMESIEENQDVVSFVQTHTELRGHDYWTGGLNPGLLWIWANSARPISGNSTNHGNENIQGKGRCLKLGFNPALQGYAYQGSDCASRVHYICEYEENTTVRRLDRIAKALEGRKTEGVLKTSFKYDLD